jgi:hypothetical protein
MLNTVNTKPILRVVQKPLTLNSGWMFGFGHQVWSYNMTWHDSTGLMCNSRKTFNSRRNALKIFSACPGCTYNFFKHTILNLCWVCTKNWVCWVCGNIFWCMMSVCWNIFLARLLRVRQKICVHTQHALTAFATHGHSFNICTSCSGVCTQYQQPSNGQTAWVT